MDFTSREEYTELTDLLQGWIEDPENIKALFVKLKGHLSGKERVSFSFKSRPKISYSLRAFIGRAGDMDKCLFAVVDIVDDDPENRWLSVCFYDDMVTDPAQKGNLVPKGLLGEDGYCFDVYEYDETFISYIGQRMDEAYANSVARQPIRGRR